MATQFELFLQRYRVFSGFLIAAIYVIFARPSLLAMRVGFSVAAIGLAIRFWAAGHIRKGSELDTAGPYSHTRNPLYFGSFLLAVGFGIASGVWWLAAVCILFFISIYFPVIRVESQELADVFGTQYEEYRKQVPIFFPRFTAFRKSARKFDFGLYLKNGEYNAILGAAVVSAFLLARYYGFI